MSLYFTHCNDATTLKRMESLNYKIDLRYNQQQGIKRKNSFARSTRRFSQGLNLSEVAVSRNRQTANSIYFCKTLKPDFSQSAADIFHQQRSVTPKPHLNTDKLSYLKENIEKYNNCKCEEKNNVNNQKSQLAELK